jgi:hypothetical protein
MLKAIKQAIQLGLGRLGYALVRQPKNNELQLRAASIAPKPPSLDESLVHLLDEVVAHITSHSIPGDVVDCGTGETLHLQGLTTALKSRREIFRRLILFDTSMDPSHRAEKTMPLWGTWDQALFRDDHKGLQGIPAAEDAIPREVIDRGYPTRNIIIETQVTDRAIRSNLPPQIAILIMTCDTHSANSMVLEKVLPQLVRGAKIIVRGYSPAKAEGNDAIRLLRKHFPELVLIPVWNTYWTATV